MSANELIIDTAVLFLHKNVSPSCRPGDTGSRFVHIYQQKILDIKKRKKKRLGPNPAST